MILRKIQTSQLFTGFCSLQSSSKMLQLVAFAPPLPFCSSCLPSFLFRLTVFRNIYAVVRFRDFSTLASQLHCSPSDDLAVTELRKTEVQHNWVFRFFHSKDRSAFNNFFDHAWAHIHMCIQVCFGLFPRRLQEAAARAARDPQGQGTGTEDARIMHGVARTKRSPSHPQMKPATMPRHDWWPPWRWDRT